MERLPYGFVLTARVLFDVFNGSLLCFFVESTGLCMTCFCSMDVCLCHIKCMFSFREGYIRLFEVACLLYIDDSLGWHHLN